MKHLFINTLSSALLLMSFASCNPIIPPTPDDGDEFIPYTPPETINANNLFKVCFFSTLSDVSLFASNSKSGIIDFISTFSGQKPIMYMLERCDATIGQPLAYIDIALATRYYSYFAQHTNTSSKIQGSGLLTKYIVTDYDGILNDSLHISGCTFAFPLSVTISATLYTTRVNSLSQIECLVAHRSEVLQSNALVIGSMNNSVKEDIVNYLKKSFRDYRIAFADYQGTDYDFFVLSPVDFVCREIVQKTNDGIPYFLTSIELLNTANLL